jgi:DNA-binding transcriptional LysR family regulator
VELERLLPSIWNWLPAFRAVAESQHLPTASKLLNVTPGALSRSIRQLEDAVGHELFNRVGRNLVLNTAGARLLVAINEATATIDGALASITSEPLAGPVRISTLGVMTNEFVLPAVLRLKRMQPRFVPVLENHHHRQANELLVRGHLDVAFYYDALAHEGLTIELLGTATAHVYCGKEHPLFGVEEPTLEKLLQHPFSVPQLGDNGLPMDGWPVDVPREVGMRITLLATNLEVCLSGQLLTVLPDVVARHHLAEGRIRKLPFDVISPIELYSARRDRDGEGTSAAAIIEAVKSVVAES